jgi:hypothetical protein
MKTKLDLRPLTRTLGMKLPAALANWWSRESPTFGEYVGLSPDSAAERWQSLKRLLASKAFIAKIRKRTYESDSARVQQVHWTPDWIPFAEDGGGNLLCVDTKPGPLGTVNQVIQWEIRGGGAFVRADSVEELHEKPKKAKSAKSFVAIFEIGSISGVNKRVLPVEFLKGSAWVTNSRKAGDVVFEKIKEPKLSPGQVRAVFLPFQKVEKQLAKAGFVGEAGFHPTASVNKVTQIFRRERVIVISPF